MKKGFTLIELLAVVLMVSILATIAVPQYRRSIARSRAAEAKQNLPLIYQAGERWKMEQQMQGLNDTFSFKLLDITLKGKVNASNAAYWDTSNFKYTYDKTNSKATAEMLIGKYAGTTIPYDANGFGTCVPPSGVANACTDLGF